MTITPTNIPTLKVRFLPAIPGANVQAKVNRSGDTMTGSLLLNHDPVVSLEAATKNYVDTHSGGGGGGTPGGANTQIQFNDTAAFGGDPDFTWNKFTNTLAFGSGAVIDWNAGDVTLTHSFNTLTIAGASTVSFGIGGELVTGTIQLGDLADTTLARFAAGKLSVEGIEVILASGSQTLTGKTIALGNNTITGTVSDFNTALTGADFYTTGGTDVALADGGTGASLVAPAVDRLMIWDQGTTSVAFANLANVTTEASPTTGDFIYIQKQGTDDLKKVNWSSLPGVGGGAPTTSSYLTLSADGTLSAERVLTAGTNVSFVDGGANSTLTINVAGTPSNVLNEATDTTCFPAFFTAATGSLDPKTNANLTYNSATGAFSIGIAAALTVGTIELGNATDTTLSRVSPGVAAIEGNTILTAATGQPLDADLTSWALVTRAAGFDTFAATPSSANLAALVTGETGTGALVFNVSPTFTTPTLGTPTSGNLTNCAGLPTIMVSNEAVDTTCFVAFTTAAGAVAPGTELGIKTNANLTYNSAAGILAVGGSTVLTSASGQALSKTDDTNVTLALGGSPTTALVTAASLTLGWTGTLAPARGGTGIASLGAGIATWLGTPSSANLAAALTDETGTGPAVFATAPTFTNTAQFGTVSAATGQIRLANSASANLTTLQAGNATAARTYTWPLDFGAPGTVLADAAGNGTLSWATAPAGAPPTLITTANEATDTTCFPAFFTAATGDLGPKTNANITFNSNTGLFTHGADVVIVGTLSAPITQNSRSAAYTTVLADAGKHIFHPTTDNNARTYTIDNNTNAAYPIGTTITFYNEINTVTISIASPDVLTLAGAGTTGSRTLAAKGIATAMKVGTTSWVINGTGLT